MGRILIVDDEPIARTRLSDLLKQIEKAEHGAPSLARLREIATRKENHI